MIDNSWRGNLVFSFCFRVNFFFFFLKQMSSSHLKGKKIKTIDTAFFFCVPFDLFSPDYRSTPIDLTCFPPFCMSFRPLVAKPYCLFVSIKMKEVFVKLKKRATVSYRTFPFLFWMSFDKTQQEQFIYVFIHFTHVGWKVVSRHLPYYSRAWLVQH